MTAQGFCADRPQLLRRPIVIMSHPFVPSEVDIRADCDRETAGRQARVGTPPPGTENYMAAELFKATAGIEMTIVPYRAPGRSPTICSAAMSWSRSTRSRRRWQYPARKSARHCGCRRGALEPAARRADRDRIGAAGLRGHGALRRYSHRPERHARSLTASTGNCA